MPRGYGTDPEVVRELTERGNSAAQIAMMVGCSKRTVTRIRARLGISQPGAVLYSDETRATVYEMLKDGMSYLEVSRTMQIPPKRLWKWFPGMGWDAEQTAAYRHMLRELEQLDTRADRRVRYT